MLVNIFSLAVAFGSGILLFYMPFAGKFYVGMGVAALSCWIWRRNKKVPLVLLLALLLGLFRGWLDDFLHLSDLEQAVMHGVEEKRLEVIGKIDSFPVIDGDRVRFFLKTDRLRDELLENDGWIHATERIWVTLELLSREETEAAAEIDRGDWYKVQLTLARPEPPRNPGAFDFPQYLWKERSEWTGNAKGIKSLSSLKESGWIGWKGIVTIREFLESQLNPLFSTEIAGVMKGMLLGDRYEVSAEEEKIYRQTGILHVLAISGFHVMIVSAGLHLLLLRLGFTREHAYEALFFVLLFYMFLTGMSPSVVRACLMGMVYLVAKRTGQAYSAWKAISFVFILFALINPRYLFDIGFQLTFAVTFGLISFTEPFSIEIRRLWPYIHEKVANAIAVAVVAHFFSFPILVSNFFQTSFSSLIVNLLLMPIFAIVIPWGYIVLLVALFSDKTAKLIAFPLDGLMQLIHDLLRWISGQIEWVISVDHLPFWWWGGYVLLFLFLIGSIRVPAYKGWLMLAILFLLMLPSIIKYTSDEIRITFLDVGQGDSILIQGPRNRTMLIDGGGIGYVYDQEEWRRRRNPFEVGEDIVVPALRSLGVSRIDWLVITHGDGDHIGGLPAVIREIPVNNVLYNGDRPKTLLEKELFLLLREKGIPIYIARPGPWLQWNPMIHFSILHPPEGEEYQHLQDNDKSVVMQLEAYGRKLIFTGDLEAEGEKDLIDRTGKMNIDLLKVGHHGSKTSTTWGFLASVDPEIAVISVGEKNRYGHPAKEVLDRLKEHDIRIYRTDRHGAIRIRINSHGEMWIKSWLGEK
jgi:competence protein ComEC